MLASIVAGGCKEDAIPGQGANTGCSEADCERTPEPDPTTGTGDGSGTGTTTTGTSTTTTTTIEVDTDTDGEPIIPNCGDVKCVGPSTCVVDDAGKGSCECDPGYVDEAEGGTGGTGGIEMGDGDGHPVCIRDENCFSVRNVTNGCNTAEDGSPAVRLFFSTEYCNGDPLTETELLDRVSEGAGGSLRPESAFRIMDDDIDIVSSGEASVTLLDRDIESFVAIALDVSDSVTMDENYPLLVAGLKDLFDELEPKMGEDNVYVALYVFGREARLPRFIKWTKDFDQARAELDALRFPVSADGEVINGQGTALFSAAINGLEELDRMIYFREGVSGGGELTMGTLILITDGSDTSNTEFLPEEGDANLPDKCMDEANKNDPDCQVELKTDNRMVTLGISNEIKSEELEFLGPDGSFLVPQPEDWSAAFKTLGQRVRDFGDATHAVVFCSPHVTGTAAVNVQLNTDQSIVTVSEVSCSYDADRFDGGPGGAECNTQSLAAECDVAECGGITACGSCSDDACCVGTTCVSPGSNQSCESQSHDFCQDTAPNFACIEDSLTGLYACSPGLPLDADCNAWVGVPDACDPTQGFCRAEDGHDPAGTTTGGAGTGTGTGTDTDGPTLITDVPGKCTARVADGQSCRFGAECPTRNCGRWKTTNGGEETTCLPFPARMYERCESHSSCEAGARCSGGVRCLPQQPDSGHCDGDSDCESNRCVHNFDDDTDACAPQTACFYAWEQKLGPSSP